MPDVAAPAHCFNFGFGCSWVAAGILNGKTPRQSLGVSRGVAAAGWVWVGLDGFGWVLLTRPFSCVPLGVVSCTKLRPGHGNVVPIARLIFPECFPFLQLALL